jgi:hypothetical protein
VLGPLTQHCIFGKSKVGVASFQEISKSKNVLVTDYICPTRFPSGTFLFLWFFVLPIAFPIHSIVSCTTSKMLWSSIASVAALTAVVNGQYDGETSPPSYPSPWMRGGNGWADAYERAQAFVSQLTLLEKVNLTTGVGWEEGPCVGNTGTSRSSSVTIGSDNAWKKC